MGTRGYDESCCYGELHIVALKFPVTMVNDVAFVIEGADDGFYLPATLIRHDFQDLMRSATARLSRTNLIQGKLPATATQWTDQLLLLQRVDVL